MEIELIKDCYITKIEESTLLRNTGCNNGHLRTYSLDSEHMDL